MVSTLRMMPTIPWILLKMVSTLRMVSIIPWMALINGTREGSSRGSRGAPDRPNHTHGNKLNHFYDFLEKFYETRILCRPSLTEAGSQLTWEGGGAGITKNVTDTRGVTTDLLDV